MKALLGTRKGVMLLSEKSGKWSLTKSHFEGVKCNLTFYDHHHDLIWAGLNHGHWGPKLHISSDKGKTFKELGTPKFPENTKTSLKDFWSLNVDTKGRLWLGVEPAAIFYSDDKGATWTFLQEFWDIPTREKWFSGGTDGSCVHSLMIHPEDDNRISIGISVAGVLETRNRGKSWKYINKGLAANFLPDPTAEYGQDPHKVVQSQTNPDILWQQNHCGIFKSEDGGQNWIDLTKARGVKSGFGWGIVVDEKNPDIALTIPALSDEVRIPVNNKLMVQKTTNGGKTWKTITKGLPKEKTFEIVYRSALSLKKKNLLFGTTTGQVYTSKNLGESWAQMKTQFAPIFCVELFD